MNKLFILGLCLLCFVVYFNSLKNEFILDDYALIVDNPLIKSPKFLMQIFKASPYDYAELDRPVTSNKMYRPLQILSYGFDYQIWGLKPLGFRLTNILIHALNSILVYCLFRLLFNNLFAKIISILFAVHPINSSVVAYISGRADLLVSFFMLFSTLLFFQFTRSKLKRYYLMSVIAAALALLCRENALFLFLFILLLLFFSKAKPREFLYVLPFIVLDLLYVLLRFNLFGNQGLVMHSAFLPVPLRIINFLNIIPRYLLVLLLPLDLHLLRTTAFIKHFFDPRAIFAIGFISLYLYLVVRLRKKKPLFFSMLWFLIGLIPVFFYLDGYALLGQAMMAESWAYLSSLGFFMGFVFLNNIFNKLGKILFVSVLVFYGFLTVTNNSLWKNATIFYQNILEYNPQKNPLRKNLIKEYFRQHLYEDALEEIKKLSADFPESEETYLFQGSYYFLKGQIEQAIENYNTVLKKNKDNPYAYYNLSLCYEWLGRLDRAIHFAEEAMSLSRHYLAALVQLGDLYTQKGQPAQADSYYRLALEIDPGNNAIKEKIKHAK